VRSRAAESLRAGTLLETGGAFWSRPLDRLAAEDNETVYDAFEQVQMLAKVNWEGSITLDKLWYDDEAAVVLQDNGLKDQEGVLYRVPRYQPTGRLVDELAVYHEPHQVDRERVADHR
jgi:hypothetical protein